MSDAPAITAVGLSRRFGPVTALDGIDLEVQGPGVFGFLGVNGAGKSTTFRILSGLIKPSAGEARLFGHPAGSKAVRPRLGYLPQEPAAYPWMTGAEFVRFVGALFGLGSREARLRADEVLGLCGLSKAATRRTGGYSGGMKQRLGIAQALVSRPDLLLLDEPVSALDPVGRAELLELIRELGRTRTVFFSSHILADVERVCSEVTIIDGGRIVVRESTARLRQTQLAPVFEVQVPGPAAELIAALRAHPAVSEVLEVEADPGVACLRVTVTGLDAGRRELPALVVGLGLPLLRFEPSLPTLEEVFLRLIGRRPGEKVAA